MSDVKEFKVNEYIRLKLEEGETVIYVAGERFLQCKFLLINLPESNASSEFDSIDEAAEWLGHALEAGNPEDIKVEYNIPPETEFWGHCSNLQVWAELNYDSRLLKSNLSFPLLKKLVEAGEKKARAVFNEEIAKRLINGSNNVVTYLVNENYVQYLGYEELWSVIDALLEELRGINYEVPVWDKRNELPLEILNLLIKIGDKAALNLIKEVVLEILRLGNLANIKMLKEMRYINYLTRSEFWKVFGQDGAILHKLEARIRQLWRKREEYINFALTSRIYPDNDFDSRKMITDPNFGRMVFTYNFETRHVTGIGVRSSYRDTFKLNKLPERFWELTLLEELLLGGLGLKKLPAIIKDLKHVRKLSLERNKLKNLPKEICEIKNLEFLDVISNKLKDLPKCLCNLPNLNPILASHNPLDEKTLDFFYQHNKIYYIGKESLF